jgi:hypothetical protein
MVCHKDLYEKVINEKKIESCGFKLNEDDF